MKIQKFAAIGFLLLCISFPSQDALGKRRRRSYSGPPPTHPVILWSRTLEESKDPEQRKIAAFKLSQYSQPIFHSKVISTLMACVKDPDVQIKVLCTKALGGAKSASHEDAIRELLIAQYNSDAMLKNTIVRVLVTRKDHSPAVQRVLQDAVLKTEETDELLALLRYFEESPAIEKDLAEKLVDLYSKRTDVKVRRALIKVIGMRGSGQDKVVDLLAQCAQEKDTPLALNCLSGLQSQAKKDSRAWTAVQQTIQSEDPDVLLATLDVINNLPETKNAVVANRLLDLISDVEDADIMERSVLALGVCGEQTEPTVRALEKLFKSEKTEEATRIAAALTLGKQAISFPEGPRDMLGTCLKEGKSQSLKTACQLGLNELNQGAAKETVSSTN